MCVGPQCAMPDAVAQKRKEPLGGDRMGDPLGFGRYRDELLYHQRKECNWRRFFPQQLPGPIHHRVVPSIPSQVGSQELQLHPLLVPVLTDLQELVRTSPRFCYHSIWLKHKPVRHEFATERIRIEGFAM